MNRKTLLLLVLLSLPLVLNSPARQVWDAPPNSLEGLWLSDGYGLLFEFTGDELHSYELTSISCLAARTATRDSQHATSSTIPYTEGSSVFRVMLTDDPNTLRLRQDGNVSDIVLHRASNRPSTCNTHPPNTPPSNYAIFWQTFAEQYAFFGIHKMDWNAVDKKFRTQVTASTTPLELFQIFRQMIEPLQDAHTSISARDLKQEFGGARDDPDHLDDAGWKKAASLIESRYVHGALRPFCKGSLHFGTVGESLGYFRITRFYDYADPEGYANALQCLEQTLDAIFTGAPLRGLIIDVRLNHGGDDPLGIAIAARLTDKKYLAYTKVTRNSLDLNAPLRYTEPQPSWVLPSARPGFKGKVVLLTGPDTVSAGETFTMALFGREPHVTRIGLNTQGVFSDVLGRSLPNGWRFGLPNEVYFTVDGKAFDGSGIPPDVSVPFFSASDLRAGRDRALEFAIDLKQ